MKKIYNRKVIESIHLLLTYIMPSIAVPIKDSIEEDESYFGHYLKSAEEWGDGEIIEDIKFMKETIRR